MKIGFIFQYEEIGKIIDVGVPFILRTYCIYINMILESFLELLSENIAKI